MGTDVVYGVSIANLAMDMTGGDVKRAQQIFDTFFETFPDIKAWMDSKVKEFEEFGYVTTALGNILAVESPGDPSGTARVAVNAPIQSISSLIAGTAMWEFSEACIKHNLECYPYGFTHDAYDDSTSVDTLFQYVDLMHKVMQDDIFEKMGDPVHIDIEIGSSGADMCEMTVTDINEETREVEIEGTKEAVDGLVSRLRLSKKYIITDYEEVDSKTHSESYEELFVMGKALKDTWGRDITNIVVKFKVNGDVYL